MERQSSMKKEVQVLVPQWWKEAEQGQYSVMVGDDLDSLSSACLLKQFKGWDINWFYDFHCIYVADETIDKENRVGVDMCLQYDEKIIDNHVSKLSPDDRVNPNSINLNDLFGVSRENYTDKYAMSTLLTVWSLLGLPLPESKEGKKILLSIDSSFKGHFNSAYKETHNEYLRKLGFEELIDFLDNETSFNELDVEIRKRYRLSDKITMKKGRLFTTIDLKGIGRFLEIELELPKKEFKLSYKLNRKNAKLKKGVNYSKVKGTYSFALTYRDVASYTVL